VHFGLSSNAFESSSASYFSSSWSIWSPMSPPAFWIDAPRSWAAGANLVGSSGSRSTIRCARTSVFLRLWSLASRSRAIWSPSSTAG
jgi:hypothetical protein